MIKFDHFLESKSDQTDTKKGTGNTVFPLQICVLGVHFPKFSRLRRARITPYPKSFKNLDEALQAQADEDAGCEDWTPESILVVDEGEDVVPESDPVPEGDVVDEGDAQQR